MKSKENPLADKFAFEKSRLQAEADRLLIQQGRAQKLWALIEHLPSEDMKLIYSMIGEHLKNPLNNENHDECG